MVQRNTRAFITLFPVDIDNPRRPASCSVRTRKVRSNRWRSMLSTTHGDIRKACKVVQLLHRTQIGRPLKDTAVDEFSIFLVHVHLCVLYPGHRNHAAERRRTMSGR
ncbi:uncharacterized protein BCR38DRAFT_421875 [Pseudomassariella vexata]|uniref:Uncharacterized protein n=1 Tax=Pseudomassariella vexata TaxID=1141098 RepID=A0A1Y2EHX4_9PEZI|nr:uncharacterized protein BCR38DRAFT_421875 [Pseudomassariella vexata]ORY70375.1 hypothetical protein BCR38DRAFT_421875 [Pseudomassariella vexata]